MIDQKHEAVDVMSEEDRVLECYSLIMNALDVYGCKFDITCMLRESGTDFKVLVIPKDKKDGSDK